ncbi:type II secretion system protein GspL [Pseudomonas vancouverensis]|uniref:Type II secretion system protein L n=1 Tax=Pseudomonas vancouverensis TaxID=95300 RepID=A0A1H2PBH3_PSEVA|nr:type II secretion system protein GspL [Pseudomonas vancouverensis]KAB0493857.1 type II secretory protein pull [Pseudomonas vancouverensis]TDB58003.1 type II secretory protein pull [Pseudomonas vancouverensis]SDV15022.1 type II secretion system protein L (GspL) [Pseudomonas vancouverensis]
MNTWLYLTPEGLNLPSKTWPCCLWSAAGQRQLMSLDLAAQALNGQAIDLLLPMEVCSWVRSEPWPTKCKPEDQAIAFAVEEQLSEALETLHLSIGPCDGEGCYPVMVISRERLAAVLAVLDEVGVRAKGVFVDADLLANVQPRGVWWFGRWLLGGERIPRMAVSADNLQALMPLLPENMQWLDERQDRVAIDQWLTDRPTQSINLLQGAFAPRAKPLPWRISGLSLLMLAVLTWSAGAIRIGFLDGETQRLTAQNEQRFKALYPDQDRIVDMAAQLRVLQNQPAEAQGTRIAGLVSLIERVVGASEVEVQRIEFSETAGWRIQLTANSFTELEQLRARGRQQGMPVRLDSATKAAEKVHATLSVEDEA